MRAFQPLLQWRRDTDTLTVRFASDELVLQHAPTLARWYNDPHNRDLMAGSQEMSAGDVREVYDDMRSHGVPVLLFRNNELVGDADLRDVVEDDRAEFAIMIGERSLQGLGLGTAFSRLVHAYAFDVVGLRRVFLSIVAHNHGARRCYEKIGYVVDETELGRTYCEDATDIAMRLDRDALVR